MGTKVDAVSVGACGLWVGTTYHGFCGNIAGYPIDHILVSSEWQIRGYVILIHPVEDRYPFDHHPVVVEPELQC